MPKRKGNAPRRLYGPGCFVGRSADLAYLRERLLPDRLLPKSAPDRLIFLDPKKVLHARKAAELTQAQVAERMGSVSGKGEKITFSVGTYISAERGRRRLRIATANAVADALGVPLEMLRKPVPKPVCGSVPEPLPVSDPQPQLRVVIYGVPGIGKTTLVTALAHDAEIQRAYPTVLWAALGQECEPLTILAEWGNLTGLPGLGELSISEAGRRLAAHLNAKCILFLVDDVWKKKDADKLAITGPRSATIVTTRLMSVARELAGRKDVYKLGVLPLKEATEVIVEVLHGKISTADAKALALAVERHTLALQVAARLVIHRQTIDSLIRQLNDLKLLLSEHAPRTEDDAPLSVSAVLKLSTDFLDTTSRQCFAYLGPIREKPATFRFSDLKALWKRLGVDAFKMLRTLEDSCLLETVEDGAYWMHALLVAHATSVLADFGPEFELQCQLDHFDHWQAASLGKGKK